MAAVLPKSSGGDTEILDYLRKGQEAEDRRDPESAIELYRWILENYPESDYSPYALNNIMGCRGLQKKMALEEEYIFDLADKHQDKTLGTSALLWEPVVKAKADKKDDAIKISDNLIKEKENTELEKDLMFQQIMLYVYELEDLKNAREARDKFIKKFPEDQRSFELESLDFLFEENGYISLKQRTKSATSVPTVLTLRQNYPNPFNAITQIRYELPEAAQVRISVFNMLGQEVRQLVEKNEATGVHQVKWDGYDKAGSDVPSGIYICRIQAVNQETRKSSAQTMKMLLLK